MSRKKALARVVAVYGQVERLRLVELQQAGAAVAMAERRQAEALEVIAESHRLGHEALERGEGTEWRVQQSSRAEAEQHWQRAAELREARAVVQAEAAEMHRASRQQTEQVQKVVEGRAREEALADARREQAAADDRFGARLRMKTP